MNDKKLCVFICVTSVYFIYLYLIKFPTFLQLMNESKLGHICLELINIYAKIHSVPSVVYQSSRKTEQKIYQCIKIINVDFFCLSLRTIN